ncbi:16S rRNA (guanine(966)-N(2))-methyltransferase RsmD, partial [bacterium]|nr:16S rRNA (guanine(966)-N(2))-methyltransferase RsmD [bacterium]
MIRVIGGIYKGKRLKKVPSSRVRPMPHKLRETMFNIIQDDVKNSLFLDGFAGTGSVGIEALSRGAEKVVFVDE